MTARSQGRGVTAGTGEAVFPVAPLLLSLLVQTSVSFPNSSFSPLAPFLQGDLALSREQFGWLATAFYGAGVVTMLPAGTLADRFGVRPTFGLGLLIAGLGALVIAAGGDLAVVLAGAALCGVGNGIGLPPTTRAIMNWFPQRTRGIAMSIKQTGVALAGALMAWSLPTIALGWGRGGALAIVGALVLLSGLIAYGLYRDPPGEVGTTVQRGSPGFGAVLRHPPLVLLGLVGLFYGLVQLSLINFLVLYLKEYLGYAVVVAGLLLGWSQLAGAAGRVLWGAASDALFGGRRRLVLSLIGLLTALSTGALSLLSTEAPLPLVALIVVAIGLSAIGWNGVHMTFVAEIAGRQLSATAAALSLTLTYVGIMIGPPVFGRIVDTTGSYPDALRLLAALALVAVGLLQFVRSGRAPLRE